MPTPLDQRAAARRARGGSPSRRRAGRRAARAARRARRTARAARARSPTGCRSRGSIPFGITVIRALGDAEDVGDVAAHVVRAGDHAVGARGPSRARRRGCATAGACRPSPGGGRTRSRGRSSRHGTPPAPASARAAPATSQSCECTRSKSQLARAARRRAASMSSFIVVDPAMKRRGRFGNSRLAHAVHDHAVAVLLEPAAAPPPRVSTWTSTPSRTSCSESLRTWRARPPSIDRRVLPGDQQGAHAAALTLPFQRIRRARSTPAQSSAGGAP